MFKFGLAVTAALGMMTSVALAQTSTSTTTATQTTEPVYSPPAGSSISTTSQHTVHDDGVVTDKTKTFTAGTAITPSGELATTRKSTETTTVR